MAEQFCAAKGLILSDESFQDMGLSGYTGANLAADSALTAFLDGLRSGRIERGCYLLIEAFDRLTRMNPNNAMRLLQEVVSLGVTVVTLHDGREYSEATLGNDIMAFIFSIMSLFQGHEESRKKSQRLAAAYAEKRRIADNRLRLPFWISRSVDGTTLELKEAESRSVLRAFQLSANEGLGERAIARLLTEEMAPGANGTRWAASSVRRLLSSRSTLGEYQPHSRASGGARGPVGPPHEGFYPPVVDIGLFQRANRARRSTGPKPVGTGPRNLFSGLVFCRCGAPLHFKRRSAGDQFDRLFCSARCGESSFRYEEFEASTVLGFGELLEHRVQAQSATVGIDQRQVDELDARIAENRLRAERLLDFLADGIEVAATRARIAALEAEHNKLRDLRDELAEQAEADFGYDAIAHTVAAMEYIGNTDPTYRRVLGAVVRQWFERGDVLTGVRPRVIRWKLRSRSWSRVAVASRSSGTKPDFGTRDIAIALESSR